MYEKGISIPFPLFSIQMGFPAVFFSSAASLIGKAINENKMENLFINESETIRLCVCAKRCPTTCLWILHELTIFTILSLFFFINKYR